MVCGPQHSVQGRCKTKFVVLVIDSGLSIFFQPVFQELCYSCASFERSFDYDISQVLLGTNLARKHNPNCSDMHKCTRNLGGVIYEGKIKKLKLWSVHLSCLNDVCKHKRRRTQWSTNIWSWQSIERGGFYDVEWEPRLMSWTGEKKMRCSGKAGEKLSWLEQKPFFVEIMEVSCWVVEMKGRGDF